METITFNEDITVMYLTALSFPGGIVQAHEALHGKVPFSTGRKYFGVSRPEDGVIVYRAAATELEPGEAASLGLQTLVLEKGKYICLTLKNHMEKAQGIGKAFEQLLQQPNLDPQGYCVEWYYNDKDVHCMIRLA